MGLFLGLDSSTQSLSALIIDTDAGKVTLDESINFGESLPEYASPSGFLENPDPQIKHADPLLWLAALDLLLGRLARGGVDFSRISGISGAGQQHGSVYLNTPISEARPWSASADLAPQLAPLLSRKTAPIWMDASTQTECEEIAAAVGGHANVTSQSGSRAIERFTGPQIRAFFKREPRAYEATREIHLVSSFIASVLVGTGAPIDHGDGAGMNLLDLKTGDWSPELLSATAPGLAARLRKPVPSRTTVGEVATYFVERYGFRAGTKVVAFTGDNPSSLVGMGATEPGSAVVSLGTSDTVFAAMREPLTDPRGFGHVFGNPAGGFMCLICFANGSLSREKVAQKVGLDWPAFERAILEATAPGNDGNLMLPFFVPEITPKLLEPRVELHGSPAFEAWGEPARAARAVVEAQALSMLHHSAWIGEKPTHIRVTGGAAKNLGILQVLADVFDAKLTTLRVGNSSALGGALRAAEALSGQPFASLYTLFVGAAPGGAVSASATGPRAYGGLRERLLTRLAALGAEPLG